MIWQMGPLPQTPADAVVPLTLIPYIADQATMCQTCIFADDVAEDVFHEINQRLNRQLAVEDMVQSTRSMKGWPMWREGQETPIGYKMEWVIVQEYPMSNNLLTVSVYSHHVTIPHNECVYRWMIRAHTTVPRCSNTSLMGILEQRISSCFTDYCSPPEEGLGIYAVTKDLKIEQEWQHVYYDFYLTAAPMFEPLLGFPQVGDQMSPTPPHVNVLQTMHLKNSTDNIRALGLTVEDDLFN
jgi:hypothetical protein